MPIGTSDGKTYKDETEMVIEENRGVVDKLLGISGERYQLWPEKVIRSTIEAFKLPGDVVQGKADPASEETIGRAMELAGALVFGPAPIAARVVEGTLGSFAGVKARTFDKTKLENLDSLINLGIKDADTIWQKTGLFTGADGKLRFEINDQAAKIKNNPEFEGPLPLKEVLDHPELYKAYPELENILVKMEPTKRARSAHADINNNEIVLGPKTLDNPSVLLHEIQHYIQTIEGFNKGGTVDLNSKLRFESELGKVREMYQELVSKPQDTRTALDSKKMEILAKILDLDTNRQMAAPEVSFRNYQSVAGEVEARNVQTRLVLSEDRLKKISPEYTEDIPRELQHVDVNRVSISGPYGYNNTRNPPPY